MIQFVKENCGLDVVNEQNEKSEISSDFQKSFASNKAVKNSAERVIFNRRVGPL